MHLLRRLHVEVVGGVLQAVRVGEVLLGADAEQHVVREGVVLAQVVAVVRDHERDAGAARDPPQDLVGEPLLGNSVVLHFEVEVAFAEDLQEVARGGLGFLLLVADDLLVDLALEAGRQADEPLAVLAEQLLVDAGLVVEALEVGRRGELQEVPVPRLVSRQEHQVIAAAAARSAVQAAALRHVGLDADDRLDLGGLAPGVELDGAEHVAMVGEGDRRLARGHGGGDHVVEAVGAVEEAVLAVQMEVNEV